MNAAERTAALRALLFESPSPEVWTRILDLFETWDASEDLEVGIDYANAHLDTWDPELRVPPELWIHILLGAEPKNSIKRKWERGQRAHPAMRLVRHLELRPQWSRWGRHRRQTVKVDAKAARHIAAARALSHITLLDLSHQRFADDGVYELAEGKHLHALVDLRLSSCDLGPQAIWDLAEGGGRLLDGIEALDVSSNPIGNEGIRGLANCEGLVGLTSLNIAECRFDEEACALIAESDNLVNLRHLGVSGNYYTTKTPRWLDIILSASFAPKLESLELKGSIQDTLLETLMAHRELHLSALSVNSIQCSKDVARRFARWIVDSGIRKIDARYSCATINACLDDVIREGATLEIDVTRSKN